MAELPISAVARVARKNGAARIGPVATELLAIKTEAYLGDLVRDANKLTIHAWRKTLNRSDIELADAQRRKQM